jgi:hypothetical protein
VSEAVDPALLTAVPPVDDEDAVEDDEVSGGAGAAG